MRLALSATLSLSLLLTGCALTNTATPGTSAGALLKGSVHGGQQPVIGAHVYLFAAGTSGYGGPSVSLLDPVITGQSDSTGAYVTTDANGGFSITGDYACTSGQQVYLYALGGNPGAGANSASGLLAALGACPASGNFLASIPFIAVNEVSTVAAAYALSGFATDATHVSSSGTLLAQTDIANAFANAANLASISTGAALANTPAGNGTVPQSKINTLANILASCINSPGSASTPCFTLFANASSGGTVGAVPTDTATAAINIAHNPIAAVSGLFTLQPAIGAPFSPSLNTAPNDFTLAVGFTGGGMADSQGSIAIDASGSVWVPNPSKKTVSRFSSLGIPVAGSPYTSTSFASPSAIAIDISGNAWISDSGSGATNSGGLVELSSSGGTTQSVFDSSMGEATGVAIDPTGNIWTVSNSTGSVIEISANGTVLSGISGFYNSAVGEGDVGNLTIAPSGNVWIASLNGMFAFSNTGVSQNPHGGFSGGGLSGAKGVAIDATGDVWATNSNCSCLAEFNGTTAAELSPPNGYTGTGGPIYRNPAIDGAGNVWVISTFSTVGEVSNAGVAMAGLGGFQGGILSKTTSIAADGSGNVWTTSYSPTSGTGAYGILTEFIGASVPVVTPNAAGVATNTLGTRP